MGLRPANKRIKHEIVGVDMVRESVVRFSKGAPPTSMATESDCGWPDALQQTSSQGEAGQSLITVTAGGSTLWNLVVVRPSASSGFYGSGVELRYVDYRGKRVLDRAHVPILNVKYSSDKCGPFRDWLWQEDKFDARGADAGPGFVKCVEPPQTILDTGNDLGTFNGVAVHLNGDDLVLVSELEAGWYRYVSEWRLGADGTIRPRFRFSAVANSCVCSLHVHHVYWRFDFAIGGRDNGIVEEFNDPPLGGTSNWTAIPVEARRAKDGGRSRSWRIRDPVTEEGYALLPGAKDGLVDEEFGVGDLWALQYHPWEIDDTSVPSNDTAKARLDAFVDGESVDGQHVVLWYGAHLVHDVEAADGVRVVGPELRPLG
jgi:hypothetical protein